MKNILIFSALAFVLAMASGCDHGLTANNNTISASNIRSAIYDPVTDCSIEEVHQHNGTYYGEHYNNDGHGHHGLHADNVCLINTCEITGLHQHNSIYYAGHNNSCGHGVGSGHGNGHHQ
uniref:Lipoprotein n=1 Tax=uncultured bacterium contig00018 TaxID=1181509 RepID=A0A806KK17_9BACT|nr:hypothetical protein [uncultured bacterium contig00018]